MEFAGRLERRAEDMEFRGGFSVYLRTTGRQLQNEFNESTRWGDGDT